MTKYLIDLSLDGYESPEDEAQAGIEFIQESLDFSASSVSVEIFEQSEMITDLKKIFQKVQEDLQILDVGYAVDELVDDFMEKYPEYQWLKS